MEVRAAYAFVLALFTALILIPLLVRLAAPLGFMDAGGGRKIHTGSTPRIGGIAILLGFLLPVLIWVPLREALASFAVACLVLFGFGLADDRLNLDYRLKLLGQLLAALIVTLGGGMLIEHVPLLPIGTLPAWLALPFTVLILAGVTNAVNLSDGLDGLAGGIAAMATACLLVLAVELNDAEILITLAALLGAILGFLRFNTFPALLFMGDAGSQLLGFSIGVLAIMVTQGPELGINPALPLLILGLPILDMLTVMVGRISRGASPFRADRTHLHHRLLASGLTQSEAVGIIYGTQFLLLAAAYLLRHSPSVVILSVYAAACLMLLAGVRLLERRRAHLSRQGAARGRAVARLGAWIRRSRLLRQGPLAALRYGVPVFLVFGALATPAVSADIGLLAAALLLGLLAAFAVKLLPFFTIEHVCGFATAAMVVYLLTRLPLAATCPYCLTAVYAAFALLAALWVRFSGAVFRLNALDVLILLGALVAPALRGLGLEGLGVLALQIVVMFYSIEILIQAQPRRWDLLRIGMLLTLATLAVRGLAP